MPKAPTITCAIEETPSERIGGDRRSDRRYELALGLRWKLVRRKKTLDSGSGQTVDLSSGGVLFDAGRKLPVGMKVQLSISWPVLLQNFATLQLSIEGKIVRSDNSLAAIQIIQHEFRTAANTNDVRIPAVPVRTALAYSRASATAAGKIQ